MSSVVVTLQAVYMVMLGWLPFWFQAFVLGFIAVLAILIVLKIVAFVLDCIPFL